MSAPRGSGCDSSSTSAAQSSIRSAIRRAVQHRACRCNLLGQVNERDTNRGVVARACARPRSRVASDVDDAPRRAREYHGQRVYERRIRVEVIEREPARASRFRQRRKPGIQRAPITKLPKPSRRGLLHGLTKLTHRAVANVGNEVHVDARHLVVQQKVPNLVEHVTIAASPDEAYTRAHFEEHTDAVVSETDACGDLLGTRTAIAGVLDGVQDLEPNQGHACLERDRRES